MTNYIEEKTLKLKILTPVHISDGDEGELSPTEYVIGKEGLLHRIDLSDLLSRIPQESLDEIVQLSDNEDLIGIRNCIKKLWTARADLFRESILYSTSAGDLQTFYDNLENENQASQLQIKPFIRTARRPFIPGSSVKGAFRTALLFSLRKDQGISEEPKGKHVKMFEPTLLWYRGRDRQDTKWIIDSTKDGFKSLKTTDAFVPGGTSSIKKVLIAKRNLSGKIDIEATEGIKQFAEFLDQNTEIEMQVRLDSRFHRDLRRIGRRILSLNQIVDACRSFSTEILQREQKSFFKQFDREIVGSRISNFYDELIEMNSEPENFLFRLGRYSGKNSVSLNIINEKGEEPKSRQLISIRNEYWPIGWVLAKVA